MSLPEWRGDDLVTCTDPESGSYTPTTGYRYPRDHERNGIRFEPGQILEFVGYHRGRDVTYRGILVEVLRFDDGEIDECRVVVTHAPSDCGGEWGSLRVRIVLPPGPRVRTVARGYNPKRPTGGAALLIEE